MRTKIYHILNGDALKDQFPKSIKGERIIFRECLVEGPVHALNQEDFYEKRAHFLRSYSMEHEFDFYFDEVVPQLEALRSIPDKAEVNLWFEEDLFCQVNMWYCLAQLSQKKVSVYWVRPPELTAYGFGGRNQQELQVDFWDRKSIDHFEFWSALWQHYKNEDWQQFLHIATQLAEYYPQIVDAVEAQISRLPNGDKLGQPYQMIKDLVTQKPEASFGEIFQAFSRQAPIYGFGDLQVKRIYDSIMN